MVYKVAEGPLIKDTGSTRKSSLFEAYGSIADEKDDDDGKDDSFWKRVGTTALTTFADTAIKGVAGQLFGGIGTAVDDYYSNKGNVWHRKAEGLTSSNLSAQNRGAVFLKQHEKWVGEGKSEDEILRLALRSSVGEQVATQLAAGELMVDGRAVPITIRDNATAYSSLMNDIIDDRIKEKDGAFGKQYNEVLRLSRDNYKESPKERYTRLSQHSRKARNMFDSVIDYFQGKTPEGLEAEAIESLKNSDAYRYNLKLAEAFKQWDVHKGPEEANRIFAQVDIVDYLKQNSGYFDAKTTLDSGDRHYWDTKKDGTSVYMVQPGVWEEFRNEITGESTTKHVPLGEAVESTEVFERFKIKHGDIGNSLAGLLSNNTFSTTKASAFVKELHTIYGNEVDIYNLQSSISQGGALTGEQGLERANTIAQEIRKRLNVFTSNDENYKLTVGDMRQRDLTEERRATNSMRTSMTAALASSEYDSMSPEDKAAQINEMVITINKQYKRMRGLEANVITIDADSQQAMPIGYRLSDDGVTFVPDRGANLTIMEYALNLQKFSAWKLYDKSVTGNQVTNLRKKLGKYADMPQYIAGEGGTFENSEAYISYEESLKVVSEIGDGAIETGDETIETGDETTKPVAAADLSTINLTTIVTDRTVRQRTDSEATDVPKEDNPLILNPTYESDSTSTLAEATEAIGNSLSRDDMAKLVDPALSWNPDIPWEKRSVLNSNLFSSWSFTEGLGIRSRNKQKIQVAEWFENNKEALAAVVATEPLARKLFEEEGTLGLIKQFMPDLNKPNIKEAVVKDKPNIKEAVVKDKPNIKEAVVKDNPDTEESVVNDNFVSYIKAVENKPLSVGVTKKIRYEDVGEGAGDTIGYGHRLTAQQIKDNEVYGHSLDNLTPEMAEKILLQDLNQVNETLAETYGEKYLNLDDRRKQMLIDFQFNVRGFSNKHTYPKFKKALFAGNEEGMKAEFQRSFKNKKGKMTSLLGRNEDFRNYFFKAA